jgi:hypothetical protein
VRGNHFVHGVAFLRAQHLAQQAAQHPYGFLQRRILVDRCRMFSTALP